MSQRLLEPITTSSRLRNSPLFCPSCHSSPSKSGFVDVDHYGYHSYRCCKDSHVPRTKLHHDKLVLIWVKLLRHAGFTVLHEPRGYLVLSNKRPDFIIDDQQQFFIDVRTCDPCIPRTAPKSSSTPGFAADLGTKEKNRNWLDLVEAQGDSFLAICHEFPGLFGDGALSLLDKAAARYSSSDKQRRAFKAFWLMRIHITHSRGVVETIRHRFPFHIEDSFSHPNSGYFHANRSPSPKRWIFPTHQPALVQNHFDFMQRKKPRQPKGPFLSS